MTVELAGALGVPSPAFGGGSGRGCADAVDVGRHLRARRRCAQRKHSFIKTNFPNPNPLSPNCHTLPESLPCTRHPTNTCGQPDRRRRGAMPDLIASFLTVFVGLFPIVN